MPLPHPRLTVRSTPAWGFACAALMSVALAACHETGDIKVTSIGFKGNDAFSDSQLENVMQTRASGRFPWSAKHYFDRAAFEQDLQRLRAFYADRGYPDAQIADVQVDLSDAGDAVNLSVTIDEGQPVLVDAVHLEGFDELPADARPKPEALPLQAGEPLDRGQVAAMRDQAAQTLRDQGYPHATVRVTEQSGMDPRRVELTLQSDPGPRASFGEISLRGVPPDDEHVVRRELTFQPGDLFRESEVIKTQQRLADLPMLEFANVMPRVTEDPTATSIPVQITVAESPARRLKMGVGYGSEEKARALVQWSHVNFYGGARTASWEVRASAIERGAKFDFLEPYLLRRGLSLELSARAWRTDQLTYDSQNYGGRATLTYERDATTRDPIRIIRRDLHVGYSNEYLRYGIKQSALDDVSQREERIALGLDPDTGRASGTLAALEFGAEQIAVDDAAAPTRGTTVSLQYRHAAPWLGGTYRFDELMAEAHDYLPVGPFVVASGLRIGTVAASDAMTVPFSQRFFLGGARSLRGWGRFQVSPLDQRDQPVGGRSLLEVSSELQFPIHGRFGGTVFVDAGNVWSDDWQYRPGDLRLDAGPGLRVATPIGVVWADLGFQINPYDRLVINGKPETRHWRIQFGIGPRF